MNRNIVRRLEAIEGSRLVREPTLILTDRPLEEDEAAQALANWRAMVARGEASVSGSTLCILGPILSEHEWERPRATTH